MDQPDLKLAHPADPEPSTSMLAPYRYVQEADLALLYGTRDEAVALIERAYFAYDVLAADCDDVTVTDRAWRERNN